MNPLCRIPHFLALAAGLLLLTACKREPAHALGHEGKPSARALEPPPRSAAAHPGTETPTAEGGSRTFTFPDLGKALRDPDGEYVFPLFLQKENGKTARINGYMVPYDSLEDMGTFMLMAESGGCFFCEPPSLSQVVIVHQKPGSSKTFVEEPIQVTGTFRVWAKNSAHPDHQSGFLYVVDDATVTQLPWPDGKPQPRPAGQEHRPATPK